MGLGAARALAARGADVTVTSRSGDRLATAVERVLDGLEPADGADRIGTVGGVVCDLGDVTSIHEAVAGLERIDHLVGHGSRGAR